MVRASLLNLAAAYAPESSVTFGTIRPGGEKLSEDIITTTEARRTHMRRSLGLKEAFCIEPDIHEWDSTRKPKGELVPDGFSLRSDTDPMMTVAELRAMLLRAGLV